jgi:hypothetical protein
MVRNKENKSAISEGKILQDQVMTQIISERDSKGRD